MKKIITLCLIIIMAFSVTGCEYYESSRRISVMTYENGIFDSIQNSESYSGIRIYATKAKISYFENLVADEYEENLTTILNEGHDFLWCLEAGGLSTIAKYANDYPKMNFGVIDETMENLPSNCISVTFREYEGGFLAGYIAGLSTKNGKLGYLAGKETPVTKKYETGFLAGMAYASQETSIPLTCEIVYIGEDYNKQLAKDAALKLYKVNDCDIIFHSLQTGGIGAIEAASSANKLIIGSCTNQATYGSDAVLVSIIKNTRLAMSNVISKYLAKELQFGVNHEFGIKDRIIDISTSNKLLDNDIQNKAEEIIAKIKNDEISVPKNEEELALFKETLTPPPTEDVKQ